MEIWLMPGPLSSVVLCLFKEMFCIALFINPTNTLKTSDPQHTCKVYIALSLQTRWLRPELDT